MSGPGHDAGGATAPRQTARRHRRRDAPPLPTFALPRLRLAPGDWQSGDNLWLIDFVCPFGGTGEAVQQLREQTFKGRAAKTVRQSADGARLEMGRWAE